MSTRIRKNGQVIASLTDWEKYAGPKSSDQWVDDRSAKEAARAWLAGGELLPPEISSALAGHPEFGEVLDWSAEPEAKLLFDDFAGEPRNSDLVVHARDAKGSYLIAVEAKADEPFSDSIEVTIKKAEARQTANPRSNGLNRVSQLGEALFRNEMAINPVFKSLRYQLLTASAGALCEAERKGYGRAVLMIQEFITRKTDDDNHLKNGLDLRNFINAIHAGAMAAPESGVLYGPFFVPGGKLLKAPPQLYIGKVVRNLR